MAESTEGRIAVAFRARDVRVIGFRASQDLQAALARQAESEGLHVSDVIRRACLTDLRRRESWEKRL